MLVHPNQDRYPGQYTYVVAIQAYVHLVPFVIQPNGTRFLKTFIPSRKATREYSRSIVLARHIDTEGHSVVFYGYEDLPGRRVRG